MSSNVLHSGARHLRRRPEASARSFRNTFAFLLLALLVGLNASSAPAAGDAPTLDLNRATAEQLERLPGIGEVKAAAILAVRAERGGFRSVDELESVRGIGPALLAKLRGQVKVGPPGGGKPRKVANK